MHHPRGPLGKLIGALLTVVALAGFSAFVVAAQDNTPTPAAGQSVVPHPAHIHQGSCANLNPNPLYPLKDIQPRLKNNQLPTSQDLQGSLTAIQVEQSISTIDAKLSDLLASATAINAHASAQDITTYIACGDIGGAVIADQNTGDRVIIGLHELNNSGYSGIAILEKDGDKTKVTVYLAKNLSGPMTTPGVPAPTATATAPATSATPAS